MPAWPRKARRDERASHSSLRLEAELATPGKQHTDRPLPGVPSILSHPSACACTHARTHALCIVQTLSQREYDLLARKFEHDSDVNYVAFADYIDPENSAPTRRNIARFAATCRSVLQYGTVRSPITSIRRTVCTNPFS